MADNAQTAAEVLEAVGGKENVTNLLHCVTRLRFSLRDESVPDIEAVKKIPGVLGAQWSGGQFQVIIGQNVSKVFDEVLKLGVTNGGSIDVSEGDFEWTPANVGKAILNYLSKSMVGFIPIMMAAAMFRTVAMVIGPDMLGLITAESDLYNLLNSWLYNAGMYFLPIYLGYTAAEVLGCSRTLGMMMGGILIAPELIAMAGADPAIATTTVYGIPAPVANYSQTVLPMLLSMPVLAQVEKFMRRVIPDMLSTVLIPFLTMAVMVPVSLCALAPLGSWLGGIIGTVLFGFAEMGGFVAVAVIAALWEFLVMTGMHQVLIVLALTNMMAVGFDSSVVVAGSVAQWATWGMALGAFLRLKSKDERGAQFGYFVSGIVGGVTEPALYGCGFKFTRALAGMVIGGAVGGAIAGIFGVKVYVLGAANILGTFAGFVSGGTGNVVFGMAASAVALIVATVVSYLFGFTSEQLEEDRAAASAEKAL